MHSLMFLVPVPAEVLPTLPVTVPAVYRPVTLRLEGKLRDVGVAIGTLKAHSADIEHLARGETALTLIESHNLCCVHGNRGFFY